MLSIRPFTPSDVMHISRITQETLEENYPTTFFITIAEHWPEGFLVVTEQGNIVGFLAGVISGPSKARILMIAVKNEYRRTGLAKMLTQSFISSCILQNINTIVLEVRMSNMPAVNLYLKLGFKIVETLYSYYRDGENGLRMELLLQS